MTKFYRIFLVVVGTFNFLCSAAYAITLKITLTEQDQFKLATELSRIDVAFRSEEVIQETPYRILLKTYKFMNISQAFYINCSEKYVDASSIGIEKQCEVGFDFEKSQSNKIEAHDGFMSDFAIAEINDPSLARILYKTIGKAASTKVFFTTSEQLKFVHPVSGASFTAFRLRIDCNRDDNYSIFSCVVSAVK